MAQARHRGRQVAAKAARRKAVVAAKKQADALAGSLKGRIAVAAQGSVEICLVYDELFSVGMGSVVLARRLPTGLFGCAMFLVDVFCLGVKDTFYREMSHTDLDDLISDVRSAGQSLSPFAPAAAVKLVRGAVAYAADSGLEPGKDYRTVAKIFGDIDPAAAEDVFTFGHDGKPLYVQGPDSPARAREIVKTLERRWGTDGFGTMIEAERFSGPPVSVDMLQALFDRVDDQDDAIDADDPRIIDHDPNPVQPG